MIRRLDRSRAFVIWANTSVSLYYLISHKSNYEVVDRSFRLYAKSDNQLVVSSPRDNGHYRGIARVCS